ncbi:TPA: succinylglutamate desuccinylase [Acinetobacter baumannii]|uniref:succinylglutamate desuccinylase n=4 Tax=Acinetobacter baumannii TaxID=470 RepID=UPI0002BA856B|nr:succinylglutamate desuccinylase [Acinetobacter baumannii]AGH34436.1 succinylglutamate desuccinylase [Acinetobacter baumannii D1279779]EKT9843347.1 succinylglutamate desuccinylase [Acinetobacter baumannii]EKT9847236.1 succinylglutamate desuccinylase [Acinetobacter baumannii]EKV4085092.1 succinylglutamate desuccinylase [Acinetobacter baumannii]ELN8903284.1 succinylglutamate desuccinylase [Acinetobacter baumannii]
MIDFLKNVIKKNGYQNKRGVTKSFSWEYLAEGVLECIPHKSYKNSIVISAGIHGNETAPIEIVDRIVSDLFSGKIILNEHVLFILGNPEAIRKGKRYIDYDLNRMFCGGWSHLADSQEAKRAKEIEMLIKDFFDNKKSAIYRYHYDLHTAIKKSFIPTFALLPHKIEGHSAILLKNLEAAELDGLVFHTTKGKTFTNFTSDNFNSASATLELGKANPFGKNDLISFSPIDLVIRNIISNKDNLDRKKLPISRFKVIDTIIKKDESFVLNIEGDIPNFSLIEKGTIIAFDNKDKYQYLDKNVYVIFVNSNVKIGLRAGLVLEKF